MSEKTAWRRAAAGVAAAGAAASTLVALLLIANLVQVRTQRPLESRALESLRARLASHPEDAALREEVQALDLLARKAFFASTWQRRSGGVLLVAFVTATLAAWRVAAGGRVAALPVGENPSGAWWREAVQTRRRVAWSGAVVVVASLAAVLSTRSPLGGAPAVTANGGASRVGPDDWPFFRGPQGTGNAPAREAPLAWDGPSGKGIAWKVEVPLRGNSSPIVLAERIFLTGADEGSQEVFCYDRTRGTLVWRRPVTLPPGDARPQLHPDTGAAASTMASDGERVFAIFATGALAAFDLDGNPLWSQGLGVPDNHYGHASSLVAHGGKVIVQWDQNADAKLVAFDAATGEQAWRTPRDVISWASPALVDTGGRQELLVANGKSLASYDPRNGSLLWKSDCLGGEVGPSPAWADGLAFVANDRARAAAVRPGGEIVWEYEDELPDTASPVATKGLVFLATSYGVVVCLDARTGREVWKQELGAGYYASPVVVGERVYLLDLKGVMHVVRASPTFERLGGGALGETAMATPAIVGGRIYARGERFLYGISGE